MKTTLLLSSLVATLFLGTFHLSQAQTNSTPNVILETTVARYCQGMQLIGTIVLPIDLLFQFAIAGDDMNPFDPNRLGNWKYQVAGSDEWKPLQFF